MKKLLSLLTVSVLVLALALAAAACSSDKKTTEKETGFIYSYTRDNDIEGYHGYATVKKYVLDDEHLEYLEKGNYTDHLIDVTVPGEVVYKGNKYKVKEIGDSAFANQVLFKSVVIPSSVEKIGSGCLAGCVNLESLTVPFAGNTVNAKNEKKTLGYLFGTASVSGTVSVSARYNSGDSSNSTTFYVPASLKTVNYTGDAIGEYAFSGLKVNTINIEKNVTEIPEGAFYGVNGIQEINLPATVTKIGNYAFKNSYIYRVNFNELTALTSIGKEAFSGCTNLGYSANYTLALPATVSSLGKSAFAGCEKLVNVDLSATAVTEIPENAFYSNAKLASVKLPAGVTLAKAAFVGCEELKKENVLVGGTAIATAPAGVFDEGFFN
ncbi:MAG: leucine-rich repeat protein [Clostridia bacterium]|nr:leucine-rich repeat protein [Clostridia bacterium]